MNKFKKGNFCGGFLENWKNCCLQPQNFKSRKQHYCVCITSSFIHYCLKLTLLSVQFKMKLLLSPTTANPRLAFMEERFVSGNSLMGVLGLAASPILGLDQMLGLKRTLFSTPTTKKNQWNSSKVKFVLSRYCLDIACRFSINRPMVCFVS